MAKLSGNWIGKTRRLAIYLRDGFACAYCERDLSHVKPAAITLDHLRPRSLGGSNHTRNLVAACRACNSSKQDRRWTHFATPEARALVCRLRRRVLPLGLARSLIAGVAEGDEEDEGVT